MKRSIVRRMSLTSVIVVIISLVMFCLITIMLYTNTIRKNMNQQLVIENRIAYNLLLVDKLDEPAVYKFLSESQNLIYRKAEKEEQFTLTHTTADGFDDLDIEKILREYIQKNKKVTKYEINNTRYLMTISTNRSSEKKADSIIVSLISTEEMYALINRFIIMMVIVAFVLSVLSYGIFTIMAQRMSKPILKVIEVTKEYENRNFTPKYIAKTHDEIEELSLSVNKMAESLQRYDREKEKLFRTISHEIKTPLTSIYGYAEGMKNKVFEDFDKPLTVIMEESMRIKTMTENYIFLSKLESDIESYTFETCDLSAIVEKAIITIESLAILQDIDIEFIPKQLSSIKGDQDKLYRGILNILTNELKYTKSSISIELYEKKDQVCIQIQDDGIGFTKKALDNYNQGISSEKNNGSGVGLFISNAIIKKHQGTFEFGNNENQGAYFNISFTKNLI